jgi:hypothetical protein
MFGFELTVILVTDHSGIKISAHQLICAIAAIPTLLKIGSSLFSIDSDHRRSQNPVKSPV